MKPLEKVATFCKAYSLEAPILMAPMAGASPASLAAAVADGGGMGACGALLMPPKDILSWAKEMRSASNGAFQMNLWIPDPAPARDAEHETMMRETLADWGPNVSPDAGDAALIDFDAQCEALLSAGPTVVSSIMGLYSPAFVIRMKEAGIRWFATVTTVEEALAAEAHGADALIAQGFEAGGHRGAFEARDAAQKAVGLFSLLPAIVDRVDIPVIATGGIADSRGIAAALILGASAVQIGTGYLRTPEAGIAPAWASELAHTNPEQTIVTRAFSGRPGRSIANAYAQAMEADDMPDPTPYPVQRNLTQPMRSEAAKAEDIDRMQAWAGQSAALSTDEPATQLTRRLWEEAQALIA